MFHLFLFNMLVEFLLDFVLRLVSSFGFAGIFLLMLLESTVFPIPSELVMPFAGFMVAKGEMDFLFIVLIATSGSLAGSAISYFIGKFFGKAAFLKFGKYFLLEQKHLDIAHEWFGNFGGKTVFLCRFVPAIRHVISIPAGIAEMNFAKFALYTFAGAFCWNAFLTYSGVLLGRNWLEIAKFSGILDIIVILVFLVLVGWFVLKHLNNAKSAK